MVQRLRLDRPRGGCLPYADGQAERRAAVSADSRPAQHDAGVGCRRWFGWCVAACRSGIRRGGPDEKNRETGMKAQREYGLSLSWTRVTTVFLIDVALLVIASHLPDSWQADQNLTLWIGVGLAVIVTVRALPTNRGVPGSSAPI